jgi:hypothetical protein
MASACMWTYILIRSLSDCICPGVQTVPSASTAVGSPGSPSPGVNALSDLISSEEKEPSGLVPKVPKVCAMASRVVVVLTHHNCHSRNITKSQLRRMIACCKRLAGDLIRMTSPIRNMRRWQRCRKKVDRVQSLIQSCVVHRRFQRPGSAMPTADGHRHTSSGRSDRISTCFHNIVIVHELSIITVVEVHELSSRTSTERQRTTCTTAQQLCKETSTLPITRKDQQKHAGRQQ